MIFRAILSLFRPAVLSDTKAHDDNVHRLINVAQIEIGNVERAARQSRRMMQRDGRSEELEEKIAEARRLAADMAQMVRSDKRAEAEDGVDRLIEGMDERE